MRAKRLGWRDVVRRLKSDGWFLDSQEGSHQQYEHPTKPGKVTVKDRDKDIPIPTLRRIFQQAGWEWPPR